MLITTQAAGWCVLGDSICQRRHSGSSGQPRGIWVTFQYSKSIRNSSIVPFLVGESFCKFAQSTAVIQPCSVQNFRRIRRLKLIVWSNETLRDFSLRWVSDVSYVLVWVRCGWKQMLMTMDPYAAFVDLCYNQNHATPSSVEMAICWQRRDYVIQNDWHFEIASRWCPNECDHQPHDCLLNRLFRRRSRKISKLRVTGLCAGNSPVTGEFTAQRASNTENASICLRHHGYFDIDWANDDTSHGGIYASQDLSEIMIDAVGAFNNTAPAAVPVQCLQVLFHY